MPQKSQKIFDGTYLFPGADNSEENRKHLSFVSLNILGVPKMAFPVPETKNREQF